MSPHAPPEREAADGAADAGPPCTVRSAVGLAAALAGLAGLGVVVAEALKKWRLVPEALGPGWFAAAFAALYVCRRLSRSQAFAARLGLSAPGIRRLRRAVDFVLLLLAAAAVVSIPFLWYGTIKELAGSGKWY